MEWHRLGRDRWTSLVDTRVQAHWAAQALSAAADGWIAPAPDDSHTSMEWQAAPDRLQGQVGPAGRRLALRLTDLALMAQDGADPPGELPLTGATLAEALAWADHQMAAAARSAPRGLRVRDYDMPPHAVSDGARFAPDPDALGRLCRWTANADTLLRALVAARPGASSVRCWPHHFDIGALVVLDPSAPAATAPQIGLGASPGDRHIPEPYFYATAYPMPDPPTLPPLAGGGQWHRSDFTGAVLTATRLTDDAAGPEQAARARAFFESAIAAAHTLIEQAG